MRNIMYSQIEQHRRNVVVKLLNYLSIETNDQNIHPKIKCIKYLSEI